MSLLDKYPGSAPQGEPEHSKPNIPEQAGSDRIATSDAPSPSETRKDDSNSTTAGESRPTAPARGRQEKLGVTALGKERRRHFSKRTKVVAGVMGGLGLLGGGLAGGLAMAGGGNHHGAGTVATTNTHGNTGANTTPESSPSPEVDKAHQAKAAVLAQLEQQRANFIPTPGHVTDVHAIAQHDTCEAINLAYSYVQDGQHSDNYEAEQAMVGILNKTIDPDYARGIASSLVESDVAKQYGASDSLANFDRTHGFADPNSNYLRVFGCGPGDFEDNGFSHLYNFNLRTYIVQFQPDGSQKVVNNEVTEIPFVNAQYDSVTNVNDPNAENTWRLDGGNFNIGSMTNITIPEGANPLTAEGTPYTQ